jgi:hypothetical protein
LTCEAVGLVLYVLVPRTSDLLFNLESTPRVVATSQTWQARGVARVVQPGQYPEGLALAKTPKAAWCSVVEIRPTWLKLTPHQGNGHVQSETIDLF